ncbi:hypothetical protein GDO78_007002 [Eleutherodactylus coqui]|uniref:Uncharacterized protein n=1 Tax=Eleutherodactylus coqui TaxID=57060 RepID=A0A8J6FFZ9_ELECQ|nr:hypothetical protein GDO78_007002 [Eleutherodactylus coqui]
MRCFIQKVKYFQVTPGRVWEKIRGSFQGFTSFIGLSPCMMKCYATRVAQILSPIYDGLATFYHHICMCQELACHPLYNSRIISF